MENKLMVLIRMILNNVISKEHIQMIKSFLVD